MCICQCRLLALFGQTKSAAEWSLTEYSGQTGVLVLAKSGAIDPKRTLADFNAECPAANEPRQRILGETGLTGITMTMMVLKMQQIKDLAYLCQSPYATPIILWFDNPSLVAYPLGVSC